MVNVTNPLIFRAKYYPAYKNKVDIYYSASCSLSPLVLKLRVCNNDINKTNITVIERYKRNIFFCVKIIDEEDSDKFCLPPKKEIFNLFKSKFVITKIRAPLKSVDFIIYYVIKSLINSDSKVNTQKLLLQMAVLLIKEYELSGVKCVISGRIKGSKRARKEMFKLGDSSVASIVKHIVYRCSYVITKYGKLGIKIWLFK